MLTNRLNLLQFLLIFEIRISQFKN